MAVLQSATIGADTFRRSVAEAIREQAELSAARDSLLAKATTRLLRQLADHVESLDVDDQLLAALAEAQREGVGNSGGDNRWAPTHGVLTVLAHAGRDFDNPPTPSELLSEIVRYAVSDSRKALQERVVANAEQQVKERVEKVKARGDEAVFRAQDKEAKWQARMHHAEAELADVRKQLDHYRALAEAEDDKPKSNAKPKPKAKAAA